MVTGFERNVIQLRRWLVLLHVVVVRFMSAARNEMDEDRARER